MYSSSALKNTSEYYLVDYFDDETVLGILIDEGLSEKDARYVVENVGGVPWMMERILANGDAKGKVEELYRQHRARVLDYIDGKKVLGEDTGITFEVFKKVLDGRFPKNVEELKEMRKLVESEILFYDPLNRVVKFQTRLDERVAMEILEKEGR